jgi:glycine/D-amino acid oxidase-like deaminating enzyme
VGRHDGDNTDNPDQLDRNFNKDDEQELRSFLEIFLPKAAGKLNDGKVGLYTFTPDHDFIIDQHPDHAGVVIAAGFSGHGIKFASVIGEITTQLLTDGNTPHDISPFSLQRLL